MTQPCATVLVFRACGCRPEHPWCAHEVSVAINEALWLRTKLEREGVAPSAVDAEWREARAEAREAKDPWVLVHRMREMFVPVMLKLRG